MPKRSPPLSAARVEAARRRGDTSIELMDGLVPGLRLRIGAGRRLRWSLAIRDAHGVMRRFLVGHDLSLSDARQAAGTLKQSVKNGADPTKDKRLARLRARDARLGNGTFGALIKMYFRSGPGSALTTGREQRSRIEHVFIRHLDRPALDITPAELQVSAEDHPAAGSASHAVAYVKPLCRWAYKRGEMQRGFDELSKPINTRSQAGNRPAIDAEALRKLLPALQGPRGDAAKMMLWTGCRRSEVCGATWSEFDLDGGLWRIPAKRRKDTRSPNQKSASVANDHVVPLPRQAIALLTNLGPAGPADAIVFCNRTGRPLDNWDRWTKRVQKVFGTGGWNRHDLRRTCVTIAAELGFQPHVLSVVLGHKAIQGDRLLHVYNKSRYRLEHSQALQGVADYLDTLLCSNILPLRRAV